MKNKFIKVFGDIAIDIAVLMLAVACVINLVQREQLRKEVKKLNTQIQQIESVNAEIKYNNEQTASETDAKFQSIIEKVDENYDKLDKKIEDIKKEPDDSEIDIEVNSTDNETSTVQPASKEVTEPIIEEVATEATTEAVDEATTEAVITPEEESTVETASAPVEGMTYIGTWDISAYEWTEPQNACANGNMPTPWYTCALNGYPFGTTVYIDGLGYFVNEDICGTPGRLDIFLGDVEECKQFGIQSHDVYIVN